MDNLKINRIYHAAIYVRLSKEDSVSAGDTDKEESDSIVNQKDLIRAFLADKPDIEVKKNQNLTQLTRHIAVALMERIDVYEDCRIQVWFQYQDSYERALSLIENEGRLQSLPEALGKEEIVPGKEAIVPGREAIVPGREAIVPGREAIVPGKEAIVPKKEAIVPKKEAIAFGKEAIAPGKAAVVSRKEAIASRKEAIALRKGGDLGWRE